MDADGYADIAIRWATLPDQAPIGTEGVYVYRGGAVFQNVPALVVLDADTDIGGALAPAGDLDGDGFADLAIGARVAASRLGHVEIAWGNAALTLLDPAFLNGAIEGALWGQASATGDVNGDGYADLVVGAPGNLPSQGQGAATIVFGGPGRAANGRLPMVGAQAFDFFGYAMGAGDVDRDGYSDLIVGAPLTDDGLGAVSFYPGGPSPSADASAISHGIDAGGRYGRSIAVLGDLDGDTFPELAVGAPSIYSTKGGVFGRVYVYRGNRYPPSGSPVVLAREQTGDYLGGRIATAPP